MGGDILTNLQKLWESSQDDCRRDMDELIQREWENKQYDENINAQYESIADAEVCGYQNALRSIQKKIRVTQDKEFIKDYDDKSGGFTH